MCQTTKRQYPSVSDAQATLDRLINRWNEGTILDPCFAKRACVCPFCDTYHLTKSDARRPNSSDVFPTISLKGNQS